MFEGLLEEEDKVFAPAPAKDNAPDVVKPNGNLVAPPDLDDPLYKEEMRKQAESDIQQALINSQRELANLQDKLDAFQRQHNSPTNAAKMYMWTKTVHGTANKVKEMARLNLLSFKPSGQNTFNIMLGNDVYMIKQTISSGGLDTVNFKKLDIVSYNKLAAMFPKKAMKTNSIVIKDINTFTTKNLGVIDAKD